MSARYQFIPWVRAGAANAYTNADTLRPVLQRPDTKPLTGLPVALKVNTTPVDVPLRLYGPGDVLGLDPRAVIRTEPPPGTGDFEPNHLAAIEFDAPDFPWLFTPAAAASQGRLRPWLCLVVVERDEASLSAASGRPLPVLNAAAAELPDLAESYAVGARAGRPGRRGGARAADPHRRARAQSVAADLPAPARAAHARTCACVVPAFDAGRRAGLGLEVTDEDHLAPAWDLTQPRVDLPVYFQWEFATGEGGDFETLAALLTGVRIGAGIGRRALDASHQPFGLPEPGPLEFQGPLLAVNAPAPPAPARDLPGRAAEPGQPAGRRHPAGLRQPPGRPADRSRRRRAAALAARAQPRPGRPRRGRAGCADRPGAPGAARRVRLGAARRGRRGGAAREPARLRRGGARLVLPPPPADDGHRAPAAVPRAGPGARADVAADARRLARRQGRAGGLHVGGLPARAATRRDRRAPAFAEPAVAAAAREQRARAADDRRSRARYARARVSGPRARRRSRRRGRSSRRRWRAS